MTNIATNKKAPICRDLYHLFDVRCMKIGSHILFNYRLEETSLLRMFVNITFTLLFSFCCKMVFDPRERSNNLIHNKGRLS